MSEAFWRKRGQPWKVGCLKVLMVFLAVCILLSILSPSIDLSKGADSDENWPNVEESPGKLHFLPGVSDPRLQKLRAHRFHHKAKRTKPPKPHPPFTAWEQGPEYEALLDSIKPWEPPPDTGRASGQRQNWSIAFFRVSTEPLEPFELCCFYSAGVHNPTATVKILTGKNFTFELPKTFPPNVRVETMQYETVFKDTPLESWYSSREWEKAPVPLSRIRHVANAARHAYVWKYGSAYLDTDMVTLRPFGGLRNALAFQCTDNKLRVRSGKRDALAVNGAFLSFDRGHPYLEMVMNVTRDTFMREVTEGHYGPKMLTRMVPVYELRKQRRELSDNAPPLHVLPHEHIYPFRFTEQGDLFGVPGRKPWLDRNLQKAYTVHLWRNGQRRKNNPHLKAKPGTVMAKIYQEHCPPFSQSLISV